MAAPHRTRLRQVIREGDPFAAHAQNGLDSPGFVR
jgi:hypothetical protein